MKERSLQAIRDIALAFPGAVEREAFAQATFRVSDRVFVTHEAGEGGSDARLTMPTAPGVQEELLEYGAPYFEPAFVGAQGWIGIEIDDETDWRRVEDLVIDAYREVAPLALARSIGVRPEGRSLGAEAMLRVGSIIGELVEGKPPKDQEVAEDVADDDLDDGLKLDFDPDDPTSTSIEV